MAKAWVLHDVGDIRYEDAEIPKPGTGEVLLRVRAAGICGSDIPRIYDTGAHRMPLIPGHEFSAVVESVGESVSGMWTGKRVAVYPKIPCGKCGACLKGISDMCESYDYVGSRRDGAFAEYVIAPAANLLELPDNVSFETAAMLEPMAVAANAVRTGLGSAGQEEVGKMSVSVCGLGTIGMMVIMLLREMGCERIYAIGNKDTQKSRVMSLGISEDCFCNSRSENVPAWVKDKSGGGVDVYFECVGRNESGIYGLQCVSPGGKIILVGNPHSDMAFSRNEYWEILRKQLTLSGIWNSVFRQSVPAGGAADDWNYVLEKMGAGRITPERLISHRLKIKELEKGFRIMRDTTEDYCKVMMVQP